MARVRRGRVRSRRSCAILCEQLAAFPQLTGRRLRLELRELGYAGGYSILTDFLRDIRPNEPAPFEVRFETPPGRQVAGAVLGIEPVSDDTILAASRPSLVCIWQR